MKTAPRTLLAAALLAALLPAAAPAARKAPPPTPDYNKAIDWVLLETNKTDAAGFDVFYVYPTLTNDPDQPLMDRTNPDVAEKTVGFVTAQTRALADVGGRIFAPYVRQAAYGPVISQILGKVPEGAPDPTETGVRDTLEAFRIFRERWNQGRPYVLFGHSQGAMDLFELLKRDASISVADGFVAAYLPGLPKITPEQFQAALGTRFSPAVEPRGSGVVAVWHTQASDCTENPLFTVPGGLCVNPLTWTTNTTPAPASLNRFAELYNYKRPELADRYPGFCGATLHPEKGAITVDLPSDSEWDARGFIGRGCFHMNDIWFFAGNIATNAAERVSAWRDAKAPAGDAAEEKADDAPAAPAA